MKEAHCAGNSTWAFGAGFKEKNTQGAGAAVAGAAETLRLTKTIYAWYSNKEPLIPLHENKVTDNGSLRLEGAASPLTMDRVPRRQQIEVTTPKVALLSASSRGDILLRRAESSNIPPEAVREIDYIESSVAGGVSVSSAAIASFAVPVIPESAQVQSTATSSREGISQFSRKR
ncbi:hypothetical protein ACFWPM_37925 [Streptomyces sp. NPDC058479]|uniref:hypothetical protein n=1 Tax=unclassified Streptomyces TaxID=2593676 RepID=UPI00365230FD